MNTVAIEIDASDENLVLVPAQPGRSIRLLGLLLSSHEVASVQLLADPGEDPRMLLPTVYLDSMQYLTLSLSRRRALVTEPGEALIARAVAGGPSMQMSLLAWYEYAS